MNEYDDYYELNDLCYFVMALEDRRFFRHCGFDFFSFVREVFKAACKKKHGGASTIDMQLVRTITGFKDLTLYRNLFFFQPLVQFCFFLFDLQSFSSVFLMKLSRLIFQ